MDQLRFAVLAFIALCPTQSRSQVPIASHTTKPTALVAAELARDKATIRTALVEYSIRESEADEVGAMERFFTWQCADDAIVAVNRGDEVGIGVPWKPSPEGEIQGYSGAVHFLLSGHELWMHRDEAIYADVCGRAERGTFDVIDIRRIGLSPVGQDQTYDDFVRAAGLPPAQYTTSAEGELTVVTAPTSAGEVRWWIDPAKNWNVVRTAVYRGDQLLGERRFELEEIDGVWFPRRIEHFAYGDGPTDTPRTVIEVHYAEFNRPDHPQVLLPQHIGVEPGTWITYQDGKTPSGIFDGTAVVQPADFLGRVARGEVQRGPTVSREIARTRAARRRAAPPAQSSPPAPSSPPEPASQPASQVAGWESAWERYTREFITRFALDAEQTQRALSILKDCQERGQRFVSARRTELDRLDGQLADARRFGDANALAALAEQAAALRAPVDEIFERQLKPRLDRLPTKQQRAQAGRAGAHVPPTSAPARP